MYIYIQFIVDSFACTNTLNSLAAHKYIIIFLFFQLISVDANLFSYNCSVVFITLFARRKLIRAKKIFIVALLKTPQTHNIADIYIQQNSESRYFWHTHTITRQQQTFFFLIQCRGQTIFFLQSTVNMHIVVSEILAMCVASVNNFFLHFCQA